MKELKNMTVEELIVLDSLNSLMQDSQYRDELIRRAKEWEDFKEKNKEKWTIAGIVLRDMKNENQKD